MSELSEFNTDIRVVDNNVELSLTHNPSELTITKTIPYDSIHIARFKCNVFHSLFKDKPLKLIAMIVSC